MILKITLTTAKITSYQTITQYSAEIKNVYYTLQKYKYIV